jgi:hypothetical protein
MSGFCLVVLACLVSATPLSSSFYLGSYAQWKEFKDQLGDVTYKNLNKHHTKHSNVDRIWLKRKDDWAQQNWDARDRIWLRRRSGEEDAADATSEDWAQQNWDPRSRIWLGRRSGDKDAADETSPNDLAPQNWDPRNRIWLGRRSAEKDAVDATSEDWAQPNLDPRNRIWLGRRSGEEDAADATSDDWAQQKLDPRNRIWLKRRRAEKDAADATPDAAAKPAPLDAFRNDVLDGANFLRLQEDVERLQAGDKRIPSGEKFESPDEIEFDQSNSDSEREADARGNLRYDVTLDSKGDVHLYWDIGKFLK